MAVYEQRMDTRVPSSFLVTLRTPFGDEVLQARNLSFGGMQVEKGRSLLGRRDEMDLKFRLPTGAGPIICGAEVVYDSGGLIGLRFAGLTIMQAELLGRYLTNTIGDNWFN